MQSLEFEGKTTEDAIEKARAQLNLDKDQMEIEILEPGSPGIFGLVGGRKARIKVILPEKEPAPPETEEPSEIPGPGKIDKKEADPSVNAEEGLPIAKEALETILSLIPMDGVSVRAEHTDGTIFLKIEGDTSGILIGRKGRTLDALQFIVNKIVNKTLERRAQVVVDSEGYRERRREFLVQMAVKMGDKAKRIGKPVATNMLNPHDRRIVHLALRDDEGLDTRSRGDGILKKVLIIPRN